ncbi:MAG: lipoate--protein ligase family protein [Candidatus Omnitrophica bacterium]|nr:lipoate--protein ligase family protein [Candidatus Omnitrophota bacterium]
MKDFKLIRSNPASAAYNMALDEKIFWRYLKDKIPVLRIYSWQAPSFTYGVSQKNPGKEINLTQCAEDKVYLAKRMTGGGVLFHNDEITYSFVLSKEDIGEDKNIFVSYRNTCAFLVSFYKSLGLNPSFALEADDFDENSTTHPLCCASREKYDILINGRKIGGNAQKRNREAIFQHGSIPLSLDWELMRKYVRYLPEKVPLSVTSLIQELKVLPGREILEQKLIEAVKNIFKVNFIEEEEPLFETALA